MNKLQNTMDYVVLFTLVGGLGAVGGVANELLQTYRGHIGLIRFVHVERRDRRLDLGVIASVLLGAVAALVVLLFFPLEPGAATQAAGATRAYDLIRIIPLSLLAGIGGSAVLAAAKARLVAALSTQQISQVTQTSKQVLDNVGARSEQQLQDKVQAAIDSDVKPKLEDLLVSNRGHVPKIVVDTLQAEPGFSNERLETLTRHAHVDRATEITPDLAPILASLTDQVTQSVQQSLREEVELGKKTISAAASIPEATA